MYDRGTEKPSPTLGVVRSKGSCDVEARLKLIAGASWARSASSSASCAI